ncbi:MAG: deoxyguanosinetriphosphate triphosphohydrolase [Spirochaetia bacterium]|nr:deoxyguanosinetriphosphate triphosphohydrolase [Spirochaetia bacterium]
MAQNQYLLTRHELEEREEEVLASYAMKSSATRGRRYVEEEHPFRSVYQRDRDRIIHSTAFRRLEYKTQVFVNLEGDYYRTRLTHTNEVAQLARTVARTLRLNEDLTESVALAHDIGHTPFGHSGEAVLDRLMKDEGGFEHNAQSLRVLDELEQKYPDFNGVNLSWETREGIIKHSPDYDNPSCRDFEPGLKPTLEAQTVNVADEIAYNSHDLDDGITSGILDIEMLKTTEIWGAIEETLDRKKFDTLPLDMKKYNICRALINLQITNLMNTAAANLEEHSITSVDEVRGCKKLIMAFDEPMNRLHRDLKKFLFKNFYKHYKVIRMEYKAEKIIEDLFKVYEKRGVMEDKKRGVTSSILPPEARKRLGRDSLKRVICDYIASMTDRFILDEYKKLFDPYENV